MGRRPIAVNMKRKSKEPSITAGKERTAESAGKDLLPTAEEDKPARIVSVKNPNL